MIRTELPKPPDLIEGDVEGSLREMQRWMVDVHSKMTRFLEENAIGTQEIGQAVRVPTTTVAQLTVGFRFKPVQPAIVLVVDEALGIPVLAYSDGTTFRRVTDGAPIS